MLEETTDNPGVIAFPPTLFAETLAIARLLHFIFPINFLPGMVAIASGPVV